MCSASVGQMRHDSGRKIDQIFVDHGEHQTQAQRPHTILPSYVVPPRPGLLSATKSVTNGKKRKGLTRQKFPPKGATEAVGVGS